MVIDEHPEVKKQYRAEKKEERVIDVQKMGGDIFSSGTICRVTEYAGTVKKIDTRTHVVNRSFILNHQLGK